MSRRDYKPPRRRDYKPRPHPKSTLPEPGGPRLEWEDLEVSGRWVVVGSGPIDTRFVPFALGERIAAVNGGIASVAPDDYPDLWFVNARSAPVPGWPAYRRKLNALMLEQGKDRAVETLVFMTRDEFAHRVTADRLRQHRTTWEQHVIVSRTKREGIEHRAGFRSYAKGRAIGPLGKLACSAGVFVAAALLSRGATQVRLAGFSFENAYHYLPGQELPRGSRGHVTADLKALQVLRSTFGGKLVDFHIPTPARRRWITNG